MNKDKEREYSKKNLRKRTWKRRGSDSHLFGKPRQNFEDLRDFRIAESAEQRPRLMDMAEVEKNLKLRDLTKPKTNTGRGSKKNSNVQKDMMV